MRKTSSTKLNAALVRMDTWIKKNRDKLTLKELIEELNLKLRGYYGYYGITFNLRRLRSYYQATKRLLQKWLNRRGGKRTWTWDRIIKLVEQSEWIIPMVIQDKKTGEIRSCVELWKLNDKCLHDPFLTPLLTK